jgi:osmoprotectant transport system ATP-binding protein
MDEPFGALDPVTRLELRREFHRIQQQLRKTIVIVTHDMGEAFALGTKIGVLASGRLTALDTPAGIVHSTAAEVRTLLDTMPSIEHLRAQI